MPSWPSGVRCRWEDQDHFDAAGKIKTRAARGKFFARAGTAELRTCAAVVVPTAQKLEEKINRETAKMATMAERGKIECYKS